MGKMVIQLWSNQRVPVAIPHWQIRLRTMHVTMVRSLSKSVSVSVVLGLQLPSLNAEIELENVPTAPLTEKLVQLAQIHVIPPVTMGIKHGLLKA